MGTGSELWKMPDLRKNAAGSVPVPTPEKGDRHRRQHESPPPYLSSTEPVPFFHE